LKSDTEFVAWEARLGDHHLRGTDGESIAEVDGFEQSIRRKILSKDTHRQFVAGQLFFPEIVMFEWVAVDGLVLSSVYVEIRLTVAVQIEFTQGDAAYDRLFEDTGGDDSTPQGHFSG
jgi:hypothetical protein